MRKNVQSHNIAEWRRSAAIWLRKRAVMGCLGGDRDLCPADASERLFASRGTQLNTPFRAPFPAPPVSAGNIFCAGEPARTLLTRETLTQERLAKTGQRLFPRALQKPNILSAQRAGICALH